MRGSLTYFLYNDCDGVGPALAHGQIETIAAIPTTNRARSFVIFSNIFFVLFGGGIFAAEEGLHCFPAVVRRRFRARVSFPTCN